MIFLAFEGLSEKLSAAFKKLRSKGKLNENDVKEAMREVRLALLEADVNYKVAKEFTAKVSERAVGSDVMESLTPAQMVIKIVNEELTQLMGGEEVHIKWSSKPPTVIMMCGLQGSGKTTHTGKLAKMLKKEGHRPLAVACDVYRPAAIEQLKIVAGGVGVPMFEMGKANPVKIAKEAVKHARDYGNDVVILDTAGRLHIDEALMGELEKIKAEVSPQEIFLVVDSMTGQDAVNVAKSFNDLLDITRMAGRILGMGDMLTLIEEAEEKLDQKKAQEMAEKLQKNKFDLNDLLDQFGQIKRMGPIKGILKKLPGMDMNKLDDMDVDDNIIYRNEAIILSMTPEERAKPSIINPSRKRRIAKGCGLKVEEVNRLLKQFEQMQKVMKQLGGKKGKRRKFKNLPGLGGGMNPMGGNNPFGKM